MTKKVVVGCLMCLLLVMSACTKGDQMNKVFPADQWELSSPSQQGMDEEMLMGSEEQIPELTDLVVVRNGFIVYEHHSPREYMLGEDKKLVPVYSCTKSIVSTLVGIAIDQGLIEGVEQKVADFFPEWSERSLDSRWYSMTIEHLLAMTTGLHWPEATEWNYGLKPFRESDNWLEFILARDFEAELGQTYNYNTGASHMLSIIIERVSAKSTEAFAREYLFDPIGIGEVNWPTDPQGTNTGGHGLWLRARDLARFGLLILNQGSWDGVQVVSADWVHEAVQPRNTGWSFAGDYGYQWWVTSATHMGKKVDYHYGFGFAGQLLIIVPEMDLVVVINAQNVRTPMQGRDVFVQKILRSIK